MPLITAGLAGGNQSSLLTFESGFFTIRIKGQQFTITLAVDHPGTADKG